MTSIQQARQQLQTSQQQLQQSRQQLQQQRQQTQRAQLRALSKRQLLKQTPQSAVERSAQKQQLEKQKSEAIAKIKEKEKQISKYEKEVLKPYETQIKQVEQRQKAAAKAAQYATAVRVFLGQTSGSALKGIPKDVIARAKKQAESSERQAARFAQRREKAKEEYIEFKGLQSLQLPGVTDFSKIAPSQPGTYDPSTGSYIDPTGAGMSMAQEFVPSGTKITGVDIPSFQPSIKTPKFDIQQLTTPKSGLEALGVKPEYLQQKQFFETITKPYALETQRYQDLGYGVSDAQKLATASLQRGGVSFTPQKAKEIIKGPTLAKRFAEHTGREIEQRVVHLGKETGKVFEKGYKGIKPLLEREVKVKVLPFVPPVETGITYGEVGVSVARARDWTAEYYGKRWEDIYGGTISQLPKEWQPSKVVQGKELQYKRLIEDLKNKKISRKEFQEEIKGLTITYTPEQVGEVVKGGIELASYPISAVAAPGVGLPLLLGSEVVQAQQEYVHPEKEAEKRFEKWYKEEIPKVELKEGEELLPYGEMKVEMLPQFITEVKSEAVTKGLISGGFLAGGGLWKAGAEVKKFIPKKVGTFKEFPGLKISQRQYEKGLKVRAESEAMTFKKEKEIFKLISEKEQFVPRRVPFIGGKGISKEVVGSAEAITLADDLFNMEVFKSRKEAINFVEGMSKTKTGVKYPQPKELDLIVGTLGDIPKKVKLPKLGEEFIAKQESFTISRALKVKGEDRIINFNYNLGKGGKPINVQLSIVKIPKNSRYAELKIYEKGRISKTIKEGTVYRLTDRLVADVGDIKIRKIDKDFLRYYKPKFRKVEFKKKRLPEFKLLIDYEKMPLKSDLKKLFMEGKKYETQKILERISPRGIEARLDLFYKGEEVHGLQTVAKVSEVKILGTGKGEAELFKIPKFVEKPIVKKTPFSVTFGEAPIVTKQIIKLKKPLTLIVPPKLKLPKAIIKPPTLVTPSRELPTMVGGLGLKEIPYAGTGMYERTDDISAIRMKPKVDKV